MHRAEMIAGQALRTPLAPNRLPVHTDIVHRTDLFTDTTADAGIRSMKPTGRHQETAEQGTNYIGFQERHASLMTVKTTLPAGDLDLNLSHAPRLLPAYGIPLPEHPHQTPANRRMCSA